MLRTASAAECRLGHSSTISWRVGRFKSSRGTVSNFPNTVLISCLVFLARRSVLPGPVVK